MPRKPKPTKRISDKPLTTNQLIALFREVLDRDEVNAANRPMINPKG